jgi:flagellin
MLSILSNTSSLQAQTALNNTNNNLSTSLQRLSTGLKINSGADGPAAYVISQEQSAQVAGLNTAINNTNEAVSVVQVGEGALNQVSSLLTQVRSLALDSANTGVDDANALAANQAQITNALDTINRIATNTQFGSKTLLNGSAGYNAVSTDTALSGLNSTSNTALASYSLAITQNAQAGQVAVASGANGATALSNNTNLAQNENLTFNGTTTVALTAGETNTQVANSINAETSQTGVLASLDATSGNLVLTAQNFGQNFTVQSDTAGGTAGSTGIGTTLLSTGAGASGAITYEGQNITGTLTGPGSTVSNFTGNGNVVSITSGQANGLSFTVNPNSTNSAISDGTANGATITTNNGTLQFQIGANEGQTANLAIANAQTTALGTNVANDQFSSLAQINVTTASGANDALKVIDAAISQVSNENATLGAFQTNTLQSNAANLQSTLTNTTAAESVITNTDFASEISNYTQLQTQLQAGSTVLSNANQTTSLISTLLQRA